MILHGYRTISLLYHFVFHHLLHSLHCGICCPVNFTLDVQNTNFLCNWMTVVISETQLSTHPCQALLQSVQDDKLREVEVLFGSFTNYPLGRKHMCRLFKMLFNGQRIWTSFPCVNQIHATPHDTSNHSVEFLCGNEVIIWFHKFQIRSWQITRLGQAEHGCRICSLPTPQSLFDRQVNLAAAVILLSSHPHPHPIILKTH